MGRVLGLDVGEKTIGIAMSDESCALAFPRTTILRQEGWRRDMAVLRELVKSDSVVRIVVGMPLMLDGSQGVQAAKITEFVRLLRRSVRIPIVFQDERMTTREAERLLIEAKRRPEDRKKVIDSVAACLILQSYLDSDSESNGSFESNGGYIKSKSEDQENQNNDDLDEVTV